MFRKLFVLLMALSFITTACSTVPKTVVVPKTKSMHIFGFYRDTAGNDYQYTGDITREECDQELCSATITFTSEYGDTMYLDLFDEHRSVPFTSGETILMPSLSELDKWGISSVEPIFSIK
jgi:hypothetical protein